MTKCTEFENSSIRQTWSDLFACASRNFRVGVWILALCLIGGWLNSLVFPRYRTEALILARPERDPTQTENPAFNLQENEVFIAAQLALIRSAAILTRVYQHFYPGDEPSARQLAKLQAAIKTRRIPLNSLIEVELEWNSPERSRQMLQTLISEFQQWSRGQVVEEAQQLDVFFNTSISSQQAELFRAEEHLQKFLAAAPHPVNENYYQLWFDKMLEDERELQAQKIEQERIVTELASVRKLLAEREVSKLESLADSESAQSLRSDLQDAERELLTLRQRYTDESNEVKRQRDIVAALRRLFIAEVNASVFKDVSALRKEYQGLKDRFLELVLLEAAVGARGQFLQQVLEDNVVRGRQLAALRLERIRLERDVKSRENAYVQLLQRQGDNRALLAPNQQVGVKVISPASAARKVNGFLKTTGLAVLSAGLLWLLVVYWLFMSAGRRREQYNPDGKVSVVSGRAQGF